MQLLTGLVIDLQYSADCKDITEEQVPDSQIMFANRKVDVWAPFSAQAAIQSGDLVHHNAPPQQFSKSELCR